MIVGNEPLWLGMYVGCTPNYEHVLIVVHGSDILIFKWCDMVLLIFQFNIND